MELHRIIKTDARKALHRYWAKSLVAATVVFSAYIAIALAESVLLFVFSGKESPTLDIFNLASTPVEVLAVLGAAALAFCLLMPALIIGYRKLHLVFAEGGDAVVFTLFDGFSTFGCFIKSIVFAFLLWLRRIVVTAAAFLPGAALIYAAYAFINPETRTESMLQLCAYCVGALLILLCLALGIIFMQRWFAAPYYLAAGKGIHKAFVLSAKAAKGLCPSIIRFKISYFGWALLSVLILPLLWTLPYYSTACAIYAKYLMERLEHGNAGTEPHKNPLEHRENDTEQQNEHAAVPDESFYAAGEHACGDEESFDITDEHAAELSNGGAGKNPEEFIAKIKNLGEE